MKSSIRTENNWKNRRNASGQARTLVLALAVFVGGIVVGAMWMHRGSRPTETTGVQAPSATNGVTLSGSTKALLGHLTGPVEIRYYSLLDPQTVPEGTRAFARRVSDLLSAYEREGKGQIKVVTVDAMSDANANAAAADGIQAFNREKGDACFLGLAVLANGQKESLPRLMREWEGALEYDLARTIEREMAVAAPQAPGHAAPPGPSSAETLEAVRRVIPNAGAVSLEEGTRMLREAGLVELAQAAMEGEAKVKAAQQAFLQAQGNASEADQAAARKQLQELQAEQTEKLKGVMAKWQAQVEAWKQLKAGAR